jgi:hypothetical protein
MKKSILLVFLFALLPAIAQTSPPAKPAAANPPTPICVYVSGSSLTFSTTCPPAPPAAWGTITGTISSQADLVALFAGKLDATAAAAQLVNVCAPGSYSNGKDCFPLPTVAPAAIGLPIDAKDGNGSLIFQPGTAVVCPSAIPGPGAAGPQVTCPAGLYLPWQLVSSVNGANAVADNLAVWGSGDVDPFIPRSGAQLPRLRPGYIIVDRQWTAAPAK